MEPAIVGTKTYGILRSAAQGCAVRPHNLRICDLGNSRRIRGPGTSVSFTAGAAITIGGNVSTVLRRFFPAAIMFTR